MRFLVLLLFFAPTFSFAEESPSCPYSENAVTTPAPVNTGEIKKKIYALQNESEQVIFSQSPEFDRQIEETFDTTKIKTKMEQFYTLLWVLGQQLHRQNIKSVTISKDSGRDVILVSNVFTDPSIPEHIRSIQFETSLNGSKCKFIFNRGNIDVPLNQGEGFYLYRNGKCQHAQKLVFNDTLTFQLKKNVGNLMATHFQGVDLFGDFGNRGMIDVDIQYVSLKSVEFFTGTVNGRVTAYVSREEFKKNEHNALLELITKIVPDRSVQPIDW